MRLPSSRSAAGPSVAVLLGLGLGGDLGVGDLLLLLLGRVALVLQGLLLVGQGADGAGEVVGVGGAGVEGDPGELVALQILVERGGVTEQWSEGVAAGAAHERLHGDLAELALQPVDLGLLGGDRGLGVADLGLEAVELVDGDGVVLGEGVGLLLESLELVGDLGDPRSLVGDLVGVDEAVEHDGGHQRGDADCRGDRHASPVREHDEARA